MSRITDIVYSVTKYLSILFCAVLLSCGEDNLRNDNRVSTEPVSIAYLKSLCRGDNYRIVDDYVISGTVVANDWLGELYKSVVVVDDTAGVEIAIDSEDIARWLPIYSKVKILCNGLMLARVGGKVELGAPPTEEFLLDNIEEDRAVRIIDIEGVDADFLPALKSIPNIGASDICSVIRLDGLSIVDAEQGLFWCDEVDGKAVTTMRTAIDAAGNTIAIRTLGSCRYALQQMPSGLFSIVGMVEYTNSTYALRIVNKTILY